MRLVAAFVLQSTALLLALGAEPPNRRSASVARPRLRPTPHAPRPTPHAPRPTPHAPGDALVSVLGCEAYDRGRNSAVCCPGCNINLYRVAVLNSVLNSSYMSPSRDNSTNTTTVPIIPMEIRYMVLRCTLYTRAGPWTKTTCYPSMERTSLARSVGVDL